MFVAFKGRGICQDFPRYTLHSTPENRTRKGVTPPARVIHVRQRSEAKCYLPVYDSKSPIVLSSTSFSLCGIHPIWRRTPYAECSWIYVGQSEKNLRGKATLLKLSLVSGKKYLCQALHVYPPQDMFICTTISTLLANSNFSSLYQDLPFSPATSPPIPETPNFAMYFIAI